MYVIVIYKVFNNIQFKITWVRVYGGTSHKKWLGSTGLLPKVICYNKAIKYQKCFEPLYYFLILDINSVTSKTHNWSNFCRPNGLLCLKKTAEKEYVAGWFGALFPAI